MKPQFKRAIFSLSIVVLAASAASAGVLLWKALNPPPVAFGELSVTGGAGVLAQQPAALSVGERRPDFTLPDTEGVPRSVSEFDGKLLILNFWATWCPPCLEEIPAFVRVQRDYAERGVQFLGVALDRVDAVRAFMSEHEVNYPSVHGEHQAITLSKAYGNRIGALPFTVVIAADGTVLSMHQGLLHEADLRRMLDTRL